jgi:8-oxo-dGTP diphosphatase
MSDYQIHKSAGIIIKNRKLLVERSEGTKPFIAPGGSVEKGETAKQALVRELKEEFSINVKEFDLEPFGQFSAEGANHPGQMVYMEAFIVKKWIGEPTPSSEVEEIAWITSKISEGMKVGSIFEHEVIPRLKKKGLID